MTAFDVWFVIGVLALMLPIWMIVIIALAAFTSWSLHHFDPDKTTKKPGPQGGGVFS